MYRPPFEKLEGTDLKELLKIIKQTKTKMHRLQRKMENPNYKYCEKCCPRDLTIYKCDRYFLDMAIVRYIFLGGKYEYTSKELKDIEFNDKLDDIIKITFMERSFFEVGDKIEIELFGEEVKYKGYGDERVFIRDKNSLIKELKELHLGEWEEYYTPTKFGVEVLDGNTWNLELYFKDGSKKTFGGENAYPYNYEDLIEITQ